MKNSNNKFNLMITILGVSILILATIGATFAYFSSTSKSDSQNIKTGSITLKAESSKANATNIKPTVWDPLISTDAANKDIAQINLSVNTYGTTVKGAKYDIYFATSGVKLNNESGLEGGSLSDIKWKLVDSTSDIIGEGDFTDGDFTTPVKANNKSIIIDSSAANEEEATKTYILFIYIQDNGQQNQLQNLSIDITMSAKAVQ